MNDVRMIDGLEVVKAEPVQTPLNNGSVYRKVELLTLSDGSTRYGCTWEGCDYTAPKALAVATGHWKVHEVTPDLRRVPFKDWTLEQILGRLLDAVADLEKAMAQRDRYVAKCGELQKELGEARAQVKALEKERDARQAAFRKLAGLHGEDA